MKIKQLEGAIGRQSHIKLSLKPVPKSHSSAGGVINNAEQRDRSLRTKPEQL